MQSAEVRLEGLSKHYHRTVAVDGVTLAIEPGSMLALLGPSGCGKTTCLRMIAGLVQPSAGEIYVNGKGITSVPVHRRNIGMLFQNYALFPHLTVAENVAFGLEMRGIKKKGAARRVADALALVQLAGFGERFPAQLSGGQQQRVALARALVIEPAMLLLDEPLGALDKGLRESMQVELKALQRRLGITTVMVTHDQDEALTMADRIVVMRSGRLEQIGTASEIYRKPASRFVASFIGVSNFFTGTVDRRDNLHARVATSAGVSLLIPELDAEITDVTVTLRPETVRVDRLDSASVVPDAANSVVTEIEQVIYRGFVSHYYLRLPNGERLIAFEQNQMNGHAVTHAVGDRVRASWDASSIHVLPNGAAETAH
jgi:putative spermidine/putrescine transport system ATP-binding protein/spermidine/putrescine transport system ATP-binding protein